MNQARKNVIDRVLKEREHQDTVWGEKHDDANDRGQWLAIIMQEAHHVGFSYYAKAKVIRALEKTAAVCIAALEKYERERLRDLEEQERLEEARAKEAAQLEDFNDMPFPDAPGSA